LSKRRDKRATLLKTKGVRSGFEDQMQIWLKEKKIAYEYEKHTFHYFLKEKGVCLDCDGTNVYSSHAYTPDFYLPEYDIYIETKGRFLGKDRTKHKAVKEFNPGLDIRIVFQRDDYLTKLRKTSYTKWCDSHDIPSFVRILPAPTKNREEAFLPEDWLK